jgi:hypothetical protein
MAARSDAEVSTLKLIEDGGTDAEAHTELSDKSRNIKKSREKMVQSPFGLILEYIKCELTLKSLAVSPLLRFVGLFVEFRDVYGPSYPSASSHLRIRV